MRNVWSFGAQKDRLWRAFTSLQKSRNLFPINSIVPVILNNSISFWKKFLYQLARTKIQNPSFEVSYAMEGLVSLDLTHVQYGTRELRELGMRSQYWVDLGMLALSFFIAGVSYWWLMTCFGEYLHVEKKLDCLSKQREKSTRFDMWIKTKSYSPVLFEKIIRRTIIFINWVWKYLCNVTYSFSNIARNFWW